MRLWRGVATFAVVPVLGVVCAPVEKKLYFPYCQKILNSQKRDLSDVSKIVAKRKRKTHERAGGCLYLGAVLLWGVLHLQLPVHRISPKLSPLPRDGQKDNKMLENII